VRRSGPLVETFPVSDVFTPSGYMGDGEVLGRLTASVDARCKDRPGGAQGDCYRFEYRRGAKGWAGVYWVYPANNWGSRPGRPIDGARFRQVRVRAASDSEGLATNFVVGGIADPTLPNRDRVGGATSEVIGRDWKQIRIDVSGQDFDHVIGAFAWSLAFPMNRDDEDAVVLYLDDLVWDTEAVPP
jgi:hypothetical protein